MLGFSFTFIQAQNEKLCLDSVSFLHKLKTKNYAWIQFHFYTSSKRKTMLEIGLHAPSMIKGKVSRKHMEVTTVKQDSYLTPFWLRLDRDKGEWGDSLHITYRET